MAISSNTLYDDVDSMILWWLGAYFFDLQYIKKCAPILFCCVYYLSCGFVLVIFDHIPPSVPMALVKSYDYSGDR